MTYEFRGATLYDAVRSATRPTASLLGQKKLNKLPSHYDFAARAQFGQMLFVGEGNFSFSLSIARERGVSAQALISTCYEAEEDLGDAAYSNAAALLKLGVQVKTGVDATELSSSFGKRQFHSIVFQFPNLASRSPLYGQNPNHVLVTRFLKSCTRHLKPKGQVIISTVDSPFYEGAFKMDLAAQKAGFHPPAVYTFNPKHFAGYVHQNKRNEGTAIDGRTDFATFAFSV
jgi:hypothetical protein